MLDTSTAQQSQGGLILGASAESGTAILVHMSHGWKRHVALVRRRGR